MLKRIILLLLFAFGYVACNNDQQAPEDLPSSDTILPLDVAGVIELLQKDPSNAALYQQRAVLHSDSGNFEEAFSDIERALKIDSSQASFYLARADYALRLNKTKLTKASLEKAIELEPENVKALTKLAELLFLVKYYDESISYLDSALKVDQYNAKVYFLKGMNFLEKGDTAVAISSMQTAVEQDNKYYDAYMQLGLICAETRNPLAIEYYDNAMRLQPHSLEAYYNKGIFLQDMGEYDAALQTYKQLLDINPAYKFAHYNVGAVTLLKDANNYKEALPSFTKAIESDPNYAEAYFARGTCYKELGDKNAAREDFSRALQINPNYQPAISAIKSM